MIKHIKNPARHALRSLQRSKRRDRFNYLVALEAGHSALVNRPECGETRRFLPLDRKLGRSLTERLSGQFVFVREALPIHRSIYTPHAGNKQQAKIAMRVPFTAASVG